MENLKLGDTVQLKSGGPIMTLGKETSSGSGAFSCNWFDDGAVKQAVFYAEQLKKAEPGKRVERA